MEKLARFVLGFILVIVAIIFNGFVLSKLWEWIVVYAFDAPSISVPVAIGLVLVGSKITGGYDKVKNDKNIADSISGIGEWFLKAILIQGLYLFVGWILTWFL